MDTAERMIARILASQCGCTVEEAERRVAHVKANGSSSPHAREVREAAQVVWDDLTRALRPAVQGVFAMGRSLAQALAPLARQFIDTRILMASVPPPEGEGKRADRG